MMRKAKPKLTTARYAERFMAEIARQQRRFSDAFAAWRNCKEKACRRARFCRGKASACLRRALATTPRDVRYRVHQDILARTPDNFGIAERAARLCQPDAFYDGDADGYAISELKRLRKTGRLIEHGDNLDSLRLKLVEVDSARRQARIAETSREDNSLARSLGLDLEVEG